MTYINTVYTYDEDGNVVSEEHVGVKNESEGATGTDLGE